MIIELPDSKQKVRLVIFHVFEGEYGKSPRITTVRMEDPDSHMIITQGQARCSQQDNFCKLTGRKTACQRMFKHQAERYWNGANPTIPTGMQSTGHWLWSKADRRAIFQAVCPSFFKQKKNKKAIPGR